MDGSQQTRTRLTVISDTPSSPIENQFDSIEKSLLPEVDRLYRIAAQAGNVIITGETGTGKSVCARMIHANSSRQNGPLIVKGCGGVSDDLFKAELYGHTKGAFTDAFADRAGLVEQANDGTLVLDDIDCLSRNAQQTLLEIIEQNSFSRVGDSTSQRYSSNVRYIVTTNQTPEELVESGALRRDFFHRLCRWRLHVPALHERPASISPIVQQHLKKCQKNMPEHVQKLHLSTEVMGLLSALHWRGNIRQLVEVIDNLLVFASHTRKGEIGLSAACKVLFHPQHYPTHRDLVSFADIHKPFSVHRLLDLVGWNKVLAARLLDCSRTTLYDVIQEHHIGPAD